MESIYEFKLAYNIHYLIINSKNLLAVEEIQMATVNNKQKILET